MNFLGTWEYVSIENKCDNTFFSFEEGCSEEFSSQWDNCGTFTFTQNSFIMEEVVLSDSNRESGMYGLLDNNQFVMCFSAGECIPDMYNTHNFEYNCSASTLSLIFQNEDSDGMPCASTLVLRKT